MSPSNWDKELAKIDKQLESISDDALIRAPAKATPAERARVEQERRETSTLGVFTRLVLSVALGVAMLFWPYSRCGFGLAGYLGATGVLIIAGVWSGVWTWRHRSARAHVLSLLIILWGMLLAAQEVLPRVGYARPDTPARATWSCLVTPPPLP